MTEKHVRLNLGGCDWLGNEKPPNIIIHNMSNHELDDGFPTLRDVAIIIYECTGQGTQWNLARELSQRTGFNIEILNDALGDILKEYYNMTEEDGYKKWETTAKFIEDKRYRELKKSGLIKE
jgi:hypothetical protein